MKHTPLLSAMAIHLVMLLSPGIHAYADDESKPVKPKIDGRPVYVVAGKVVVFPEGVEEAPKDYKGSIGKRPLALIKIKDKIVGEIFAYPLKGTTVDEAKSMAASAEESDKMMLLKRTTIKKGNDDVEVVTLKMDLKSNVGTPWIFHSLYFPRGDSSTTFKLVASEKQFKSLLPYFEAMLFLGRDKPERK